MTKFCTLTTMATTLLAMAMGAPISLAAQDGDIKPGVYAWFNGASPDKRSPAEIAGQCARAPHVHYPDGFMAAKKLNTKAGNDGGAPYEFQGHGQCQFSSGQMSCDVVSGAPGEGGRSGSREAAYRISASDHIILSRPGGDDIGAYIPCDIQELDQTADDGRNVLDQIVVRDDDGPLPDLDRTSTVSE
ncbi:hypothetical protein MXMO3_02391 [Maritalea myrionectae]|uniref:Uncharacterized protein n=1 Tax=Maritalea myrionectae TaxID=454601 RepID=A0A2R4MG89_9HYPH|nr:hypothetical protein [Maritalea myrionectae]AVX04904.1 hypothetical protein MXMO3_02391 [Maritalea myrionectae]